jgi:hypothetical protein
MLQFLRASSVIEILERFFGRREVVLVAEAASF